MNYNEATRAYLALVTRRELTQAKARKLLEEADSPQAAWEAYRQAQELADDLPDRLVKALCQRGWNILSPLCPEWNPLLSQIHRPPLYLYAMGEVELIQKPCVAIVGSRSATQSGLAIARKMAAELAQAGWVIVSGLARGIDGAAHQGALEVGGQTIAVLATGLDRCYPPEHQALFDRIGREGLLLTERPVGSVPMAAYFPQRNRIVAGLCQGVVVIEAGEHSGARITANLALENGRELMAVPCTPTGSLSYTPNQILREGGHPVTCAQDVMEVLRASYSKTPSKPPAKKPVPAVPEKKAPPPVPIQPPTGQSPAEAAILKRLSLGNAGFDELAEVTELAPGALGAALTLLKAKGLIRVLPGLHYEINT